MLKLSIATILLAMSANVFANDKPVYYMVYNYEDCVMADKSIIDKPNWFNVDNMTEGLIYPAVMLTNNPREKADMNIHELHKIAGEYYQNINSDEDLKLAKSCGSLIPEEIN